MKFTHTYIFLLILLLLVTATCVSGKKNNPETDISSVIVKDTVLINCLKEMFKEDSVVINKIIPHIHLIQNTYVLTINRDEAEKLGLSHVSYEKIKRKIGRLNREPQP